jgi:Flp pilus assembly pilin Flp
MFSGACGEGSPMKRSATHSSKDASGNGEFEEVVIAAAIAFAIVAVVAQLSGAVTTILN